MSDTDNWAKKLDGYYAELWRNKGLATDGKHDHVLVTEHQEELIYPGIRSRFRNLKKHIPVRV